MRRDWPAGSPEQQIGYLYAGCMDEARIDQLGNAPIRPLLAEIGQIRERGDVGRMIARFQALGIHPAFQPGTIPPENGIGVPFSLAGFSDLSAPDRVVAWVGASGLGLPDRDYYLAAEPRFAEVRTRYAAHVAAMLQLAGDDAAAAPAAAAGAIAIERALAAASLDNAGLRDLPALDHPMTVDALQKLTPSFRWSALFHVVGIDPAAVHVTEPAFLAELEHQLETAPIAAWRGYLAWHLVNSAALWLSQPFVDENFAMFGKFLAGAEQPVPRWSRCVAATEELLGDPLGQKYVARYFPPAAKARMQELVGNLLAALHDSVAQAAWMWPATRQRALDKVASFRAKIGYPERWKDESGVAIHRDQLWASASAARAWNVADNLATIDRPIDRGRWLLSASTSNAYYNPLQNEIVFPAGILQPPAFSLDAADAVNYGAIGVFIGHEISHGFDDQGMLFDAAGRLAPWWTDADGAQFAARGRCVADQFEHYAVAPGVHHNGKLVAGESIADLGGAVVAYRAFERAQRQHPAPVIDGFTPAQQFFLAWGQLRGDAIRPETERMMVQGDVHPVGRFRAIGPLSNMPEFAAAFRCPAGAAMVRAAAERCVIW